MGGINRPNDRPHRPLVLCSFLPNHHGNFDKGKFEFKTTFRKKVLELEVRFGARTVRPPEYPHCSSSGLTVPLAMRRVRPVKKTV